MRKIDFFSLALIGSFCFATGVMAKSWLARPTTPAQADLDGFHKWVYFNRNRTWDTARWMGVHLSKMPLDMWTYQEILWDNKPDVLVECGTFKGGSAYFFASIMGLMNHGRVITIDIDKYPDQPQHPRITYLVGSSTDPATLAKVKSLIQPGERVMVVLDSAHTKAHVLKELQMYSPIVSHSDYLVVEDTDLNGHPLAFGPNPGPYEAVDEFLRTDGRFIRDVGREKWGVTFFPGGWLKKTGH